MCNIYSNYFSKKDKIDYAFFIPIIFFYDKSTKILFAKYGQLKKMQVSLCTHNPYLKT